MARGATQHIAIRALGQTRAMTMVFVSGGRARVAVIVKASFRMNEARPMTLVDPEPIIETDAYREGDTRRSLLKPSDLVPFRPRADVYVTGRIVPPGGKPASKAYARLMIARGDRMVLDKRILAEGLALPGASPDASLFAELPLIYELAAQTEENPVGMPSIGGRMPLLRDAWGRPTPIGFAPIHPAWPQRRKTLADPSCIERDVFELPPDFRWAYFQAAPLDQQIEFLQGDEWIGLEGMHAEFSRIQSQLPSARAVAKAYGINESIQLVGDTVAIDADRQLCSITWRGSFLADDPAQYRSIHVVAGVELPGQPVVLNASPSSAPPPEARTGPEFPAIVPSQKPRPSPAMTMVAVGPVVGAPATPFEPKYAKAHVKANQTMIGFTPSVAKPATPFEASAKDRGQRPDFVHAAAKAAVTDPRPIAPKAYEPVIAMRPETPIKKSGGNFGATMALNLGDQAAAVARSAEAVPFAGGPRDASSAPPPSYVAVPFAPPPATSQASPPFAQPIIAPRPVALPTPPIAPLPVVARPPAAVEASRRDIAPPSIIAATDPEPAAKTLGEAFLAAMARSTRAGTPARRDAAPH